MQRPFRISGIIGLGVIAVSLVLLLLAPGETGPLPPGFTTPILAFEFAETAADVEALFAPAGSAVRAAMVTAVTRGTWLDFLYMLLYSAFLFTFCATCVRLTGNRFYYVGSVLALVALTADALENVQLLSIMGSLGGDFTSPLRWLKFFTWLKWGSLAFTFLVLIPYFARGDLLARFLATFAAVPFVLGVLAYFGPGLLNELFSLAIAAMFLLLIVYCWLYRTPMAVRPARG